MAKKDYDFSGWATKFGIKCSDGVTIAKGAFDKDDGKTVTMVYMHNHKDIDSVIGHALLETRDEGVYAYCKLNNTDKGKTAKEILRNGDVAALSIFATQLKRSTGNVITHGSIKELSLVIAPANPGAFIVESIHHSDSAFDEENFEAEIFSGDSDFIIHSEDDDSEDNVEDDNIENAEDNTSEDDDTVEHAEQTNETNETIEDIINTLSDKQKFATYYTIASTMELEGKEINDTVAQTLGDMLSMLNEKTEFGENESIQDIMDTLDDKQMGAVEHLLDSLSDSDEEDDENIQQSEDENTEENLQHNEEENSMKQNVFENQNETVNNEVLTHDEFASIIEDAKRNGSVRDALVHYLDAKENTIAHSITDVAKLFPEAQLIGEKPAVISEDTEWVAPVINGVKKSPFSRVKTIAIDVTGENARAKGYVKGNQKVEEVISALKRSHTPQTIYKLQKMDRDDVLDITEFDVIAFLKNEMRGKLNEELARAILTGDGRSASSNDKIFPEHIQPILGDNATYVTANIATVITDQDPDVALAKTAKAFIKKVRRARKDWKGSGKPDLYIDSVLLDELMLIEDKNERFIYESEEALARTMRVNRIIPVEYFGTVTRSTETKTYTLQAIMVNLTDYTVGADKGGNVTMFEDFDINFNKQEYLIETRCSGALTKPFSAVTFEVESPIANNESEGQE